MSHRNSPGAPPRGESLKMRTAFRTFAAGISGYVMLTSAVSADPIQWQVEHGGNGHWYKLVPGAIRWQPAVEAAAGAVDRPPGTVSYLATVTTKEERQFIASLTDSAHGYLLGGYQDTGDDEDHPGYVVEYEPVDCNANGIPDTCDIDCGTPSGPCDIAGCGLSNDCNENDIPDECDTGSCYDTVWVDDDWTGPGDAGGHDWGCDAFATVQEGVDAVCPDGTVNVAAGTYTEQVYIAKSLDLVGAGIHDTFLQAVPVVDRAPYDVIQWNGTVRTIDACIGVRDAGTVNISDLTVDGLDLGHDNFYGIHYFNTSGSVSDCHIKDITYSAVPTASRIVSLVATHGVGETINISFIHNYIPNFQKGGILVMGPGATFAVNSNGVTGAISDAIAGNCIQLSYGATGSTYVNIVEGAAYSGDDWAATGILLFESGSVDMVGDLVHHGQNGVNYSDWGWVHQHPTPVNLTFTDLLLINNQWSLGTQLSRDNSDVNITVSNCTVDDSSGDGIDIWGTGPDPWGGSYYTGWDNGDLSVSITGTMISASGYDGIWTGDLSGNANTVHSFDVYETAFNGNTSSAINNNLPGFTINASGCWWGDATGPVQGTLSSRGLRPVAPPVQPFGEDLPANGASTTTESASTRMADGDTIFGPVDYTPWMANDGVYVFPGFEGDFAELWVDDNSPQTQTTCRIQEGIDMVTASTVNVAAGTYDGPLNIEGHAGLNIIGVDKNTVIYVPSSTLGWNVATYAETRQTSVRIVDSTDIVVQNMTMDFDTIKGNNVFGVFGWNSSVSVESSILKNMSVPDATGGYYELTSYFRAPDYTVNDRADVSLSDNIFIDTGRVGVVTHDHVWAVINGNTFYKTTDDFGYAIELGSQSAGSISGNTIYGYDTPAASDGSESAGIYIENCFTAGSPGIVKVVFLTGNEVYDCQYAAWIGNGHDGFAGDVSILLIATSNHFHDNIEGAVVIQDEDAEAGSSVNGSFHGNRIADNGGNGYSIFSDGDGDISTSIRYDTITGNDVGIYLNDYADPATSTSAYDITVRDSIICGNTTFGVQNECSGTEILAHYNWWGDVDGPYDAANDPGEGIEVFLPCTGSPQAEINEDGAPDNIGDTSTAVVDYCPWLTFSPFCGDGVVDPCEQCDDGNSSDEDDCLNTCVENVCADGFVDMQGPDAEDCDDGNLDDGDCCSATCSFELSGDPCDLDDDLCTIDECDGAGMCEYSDGDVVCQAPIPPCEAGQECIPATGYCSDLPDPAVGVPCDTDYNECTLDQCDGNGNCVHPSNGMCGACCLPDLSCRDDVLDDTCASLGGEFVAASEPCGADSDGDGVVDHCDTCDGVDDHVYGPCDKDTIPTVSHWGLIVLALLLVTVAKVYFGRRRHRVS
ncbi:MAG: IPTL-CTERM sorting domain-containing protein [Phycisphaerales bacterium]|nr:MAG: IPTL-CTERM sorting domain-containing protein [Phycisphaerales bacterium]